MNTEATATHNEQEIATAFAAYQATVADIAQSGDWARFAKMSLRWARVAAKHGGSARRGVTS